MPRLGSSAKPRRDVCWKSGPIPVRAKEIVRLLKDNGLGGGKALERKLDSGKLEGNSQWEAFQAGMDTLGKEVVKAKVQSDYALVVELLIHPDQSKEVAVWGIHCYVLDREGSNAFSFLLNSHHKMFVDAALKTQDRSAKGQEELVAGAVRTALKALEQQVEEAALSDNVHAEDPGEILQRRVGTWVTETTYKKAEWTPEETTTKGEETIRWMLDNRVLLTEGWSQPNDHKSTGLMVYDEQTKQYRSWWFDNKGVIPRSDTTGQWDAQSESLNFHSDLGNGNTQTLKLVFTNKDRFDWTMIIRNQDGRTMMDMVGHTTRFAVLGTWEIVGFYGAANDGGTFVRTVKKALVKVGDRVLVTGTGLYDGNWRVLQAFQYKDPMDPQPLWGYRIEPKWQGVPPGFTIEGGVPARNEAKLQPLPPAEASKPK